MLSIKPCSPKDYHCKKFVDAKGVIYIQENRLRTLSRVEHKILSEGVGTISAYITMSLRLIEGKGFIRVDILKQMTIKDLTCGLANINLPNLQPLLAQNRDAKPEIHCSKDMVDV